MLAPKIQCLWRPQYHYNFSKAKDKDTKKHKDEDKDKVDGKCRKCWRPKSNVYDTHNTIITFQNTKTKTKSNTNTKTKTKFIGNVGNAGTQNLMSMTPTHRTITTFKQTKTKTPRNINIKTKTKTKLIRSIGNTGAQNPMCMILTFQKYHIGIGWKWFSSIIIVAMIIMMNIVMWCVLFSFWISTDARQPVPPV